MPAVGSGRAYLGLGSNVGDRWAHLRKAASGLAGYGLDVAVSPVYETMPLGGPPGQRTFLNCVVGMRTDLDPRNLLAVAHGLEGQAGRVRTVRNGPRPLDVDLLLFGSLRIEEEDLVVPHPRLYRRAFVLAPLEDLDPDLVPARWRERLGGTALVSSQVRHVGSL